MKENRTHAPICGSGLGFGCQGSAFRVQCSVFSVQGSGWVGFVCIRLFRLMVRIFTFGCQGLGTSSPRCSTLWASYIASSICSHRAFVITTRDHRKLLHICIILVIVKQPLIQINRIDGPTEYLSLALVAVRPVRFISRGAPSTIQSMLLHQIKPPV